MITYSLNQMGPWWTSWYEKNGIPLKYKTEYNRIIGKELTTPVPEYYVASGRIDIRDSTKAGYDGWDEYGVPLMKQLSWNLLSDWLDELKTEEIIEYSRLIEMFEMQTRHKIEWFNGLENV